MHNDNRAEETTPSRRAEPYYDEGEDAARSGLAAIPLSVWGLGFVVALLVLVVCGLWLLYLLRGQVAVGGPTPTPIIWTPTPAATPTPPPTDTAEPTPTVSPDIAIGRYVRVTGTEGYGLSLREGPGGSYTRMDVALEGEVFIVVEGPTVVAGSQWWKVRDLDNEQREWWAIGNFLEPVEHP